VSVGAADNNGPQRAMVVPSHGIGRLKPFPKGVSGNPGGRSNERRALDEAIEKQEIPKVHALLAALYDRAMEGDLFAAKMWLDQVRGPVKPRKEDEIGDAVESKLLELIAQAKAAKKGSQQGP
jgi:Family of unknown function (DUF5681)